MYPLAEVLLLLTCATICSCDDFDEIAAWGESHLDFLRRFAEFHFGIPGERWLRDLVNRIDPILFGRCFESWIAALWPGRHDLIAIDGKTSRRTHDKRKGLKALHTLSAYATNARLTLAQLSVPEKTNEITAIPELLDQLADTRQLKGALVTIDAMGCQVEIANKIVAHGADYLLALKGNQPTLEADVEIYFDNAPEDRTRHQNDGRERPWPHRDETFTDMARFGEKKLSLLRRFRPFEDGTPAHDHLGDILATLDTEAFDVALSPGSRRKRGFRPKWSPSTARPCAGPVRRPRRRRKISRVRSTSCRLSPRVSVWFSAR